MADSVDLRDLVNRVSRTTDYDEAAVREIIDALFEAIEHGLMTKGRVSIRSFGILEVVYRPGGPQKTGLPRFADAGGVVMVAPKHIPTFRPSKQLKSRIQDSRARDITALANPELDV